MRLTLTREAADFLLAAAERDGTEPNMLLSEIVLAWRDEEEREADPLAEHELKR